MADDANFLTKEIIEMIKRLEKRMEKLDHAYMKETKGMLKMATTLEIWNKKTQLAQKNADLREIQDLRELKIKREAIKLEEGLSNLRRRNKSRLEQEHQEGVQRNIKLRHSLEGMTISVNRVTGMLGGIGARQGMGMGFGVFTKVLQTQQQKGQTERDINSLIHSLEEKQEKLPKFDEGWSADKKEAWHAQEEEIKMMNESLKGLRKELVNLTESPAGQILENPTIKKMASKFEGLAQFLGEHKNGIIISAFSIGLLVGAFKKLLSVSPMLQKMLELMNLSFNLVLRPFGDFIGFILRPIAMLLLSTVMPFFREAYPLLAQLGTEIGEKLVKGDILGAIFALGEKISPWDVLDYVFKSLSGQEPDKPIEGQIGLAGAGIAAGGVLGVGSTAYMGKKIFDKATGRGDKTTTQKTKTTKTTKTSLQDYEDIDKQKNKKNFRGRFKANLAGLQGKIPADKLAKVAKWGARFGTKAIPIAGWALLAAEVGLSVVKAVNPDAYDALREGAIGTLGEDVGGFLVPETSMAEDIWNLGQTAVGNQPVSGGISESMTQVSSGDTTIFNQNIGMVATSVDVNELTNATSEALHKNKKGRWGG